MKPLFKISLFFIGSVFVIFLCYFIIKSNYKENEEKYVEVPRDGLIDTAEYEPPETFNTEVTSEEPYIEFEEVTDFAYYMTCVDGYVTVLYPDLNTIFFETGIYIDDLPYEIRESIVEGRIMNSVEEIYNFLESYTS